MIPHQEYDSWRSNYWTNQSDKMTYGASFIERFGHIPEVIKMDNETDVRFIADHHAAYIIICHRYCLVKF